MFCGAVSHLMELDALVHLPVEAFAGSTVGWVKCCVVAIGTSPTSHLSVAVGAGKSGVQHNLLQTLPIFPLEISDERIISFPIRETVLLKHISMNSLHCKDNKRCVGSQMPDAKQLIIYPCCKSQQGYRVMC